MIHPRLRPYFKLIKHVKGPFIGAVLFGILYGISSGFGLPFMTKTIFPLIFSGELHTHPHKYFIKLDDDSMAILEWKNGWYTKQAGMVTNSPPAGVSAFENAAQIKIANSKESPKLSLQKEELNLIWLSNGTDDPRQIAGPIYIQENGKGDLKELVSSSFSPSEFIRSLKLSQWQMIMLAVGLVPITFAIRGFSGFMNVYLINFSGLKVLEEIRRKIFKKIQEVEISFFTERPQGDLMSRLFNDTTQLQHSVVNVANDLIKQPITFIGAMAFLIYTSIEQSEIAFILFSLAIIPICVIPIRFAGKKLLKKALQMQIQTGKATAMVQENLSGHREVRAFNLQNREIKRFTQVIQSLFKEQMKIVKYSSFLSPTIEFISAIGISMAIYYAAGKGITLEDFTPLVMALYLSYEPIKKLGAIHNQIKKGLASLDRIEEILHQPPGIKDPINPETFPKQIDRVAFEKVCFEYNKENPKVLSEVSLMTSMGESIALVGPSGAGKTTLIQLLCRFYDPSKGRIMINDHDIKSFSLSELRENISLVSQDTVLFNDTIENNIKLGNLNATRDEISTAAKNAQALDFINKLPEGFDTVIGEKGSKLSGGQKQRISIARAFLKQAPIIIFDEATSALDTENEAKVQQAMSQLIVGKLAFIIAHRLSTVKHADQIVVMENGSVNATGNHEELMLSSALYHQLVKKQSLS